MKIPAEMHIGGCKWDVQYSDHLGMAGSCNACCNLDELRIIVGNDISAEKQSQAFLHELLHIAFELSALDLRFPKDAEEEIIKALANQLYSILSDNSLLKER